MDAVILDRLYGTAVGAAAGDALGMPLEFRPAVPLDRLVREMRPGRLPAGSITDDTEMALALAESLAASGRLDPADLAGRFVCWFKTDPPDVGNQTRRVLSLIAKGLSWREAGEQAARQQPNSAGNGSLMRCWPVAVAAWQDQPRLIEESILQSRVTHDHPDCNTACAFVNCMIARLIQGDTIRQSFEHSLNAVPLTGQMQEMVLAAALKERAALPNTGWVLHTLESALWGLLTTGSFEEAVVQVANLGDDADTAAAVTGALAGAAYGLAAVPAAWRQALQGKWPPGSTQTWREIEILGLVDRLIQPG